MVNPPHKSFGECLYKSIMPKTLPGADCCSTVQICEIKGDCSLAFTRTVLEQMNRGHYLHLCSEFPKVRQWIQQAGVAHASKWFLTMMTLLNHLHLIHASSSNEDTSAQEVPKFLQAQDFSCHNLHFPLPADPCLQRVSITIWSIQERDYLGHILKYKKLGRQTVHNPLCRRLWATEVQSSQSKLVLFEIKCS